MKQSWKILQIVLIRQILYTLGISIALLYYLKGYLTWKEETHGTFKKNIS